MPQNYGLFVGMLPKAGAPLSLKLSKAWDEQPAGYIVLNQTEVRRALGIMQTPVRVKVAADHPAYATLIELARTSQAQVTKMEAMGLRAKEDRKNRGLMARLREEFSF